jgi:hypothetical protein
MARTIPAEVLDDMDLIDACNAEIEQSRRSSTSSSSWELKDLELYEELLSRYVEAVV